MAAETLFEELKRYVRFDDEDHDLLATFGPLAEPHFQRIAELFYRRVLEHEGATNVLTSDDQVDRLKKSLTRWMQRLFMGRRDEAHFEETARIGRAHVRVGLPQKYMTVAMSVVRSELGALVGHLPADVASPTLSALHRALDLELAVMLETYKNALVDRIQQVDREERERLERLAAGLAHEIRNPLNGAKLHITFLERGLAKLASYCMEDPSADAAHADLTEAAHTVHGELLRLSNLVTDFLDFAHPNPHKLSVADLHVICERAVGSVWADASTKGIVIEQDLPKAEIRARVDAGKIEQALINMLRNAVEALEAAKKGKIVLRMRRSSKDILIDVEDDGPGLTAPSAPVFDPFFSTKPRGTGLGLSIVHRVVGDHGGRVSVDSRPGRTVFRIALPLALLQDPEAIGSETSNNERPSL